MAKCIFCGCEQADFKGTFLLKNDGTIAYYCSDKCRKNHLKLGRDKTRLKWTEAYRIAKTKRTNAGSLNKALKPRRKK
ncbi:MAG: 50S ribosomal protein L24e [Nanoarchaeota archaeon]